MKTRRSIYEVQIQYEFQKETTQKGRQGNNTKKKFLCFISNTKKQNPKDVSFNQTSERLVLLEGHTEYFSIWRQNLDQRKPLQNSTAWEEKEINRK